MKITYDKKIIIEIDPEENLDLLWELKRSIKNTITRIEEGNKLIIDKVFISENDIIKIKEWCTKDNILAIEQAKKEAFKDMQWYIKNQFGSEEEFIKAIEHDSLAQSDPVALNEIGNDRCKGEFKSVV